MKLCEYVVAITKLALDPELKNLEVFYAYDDEGNGFAPVVYLPSILKTSDIAKDMVIETPKGEKVIILN